MCYSCILSAELIPELIYIDCVDVLLIAECWLFESITKNQVFPVDVCLCDWLQCLSLLRSINGTAVSSVSLF